MRQFEAKKADFLDTEYTTEDVWQRREDRLLLFDLLDAWKEASITYHEKAVKKEIDLTVGSEEDHVLRLVDFLGTTVSESVIEFLMIYSIFICGNC